MPTKTARLKRKKRLFNKLKRRSKYFYLRILRINDSPEVIAKGAAIGVFMGIFPTFGLGALLAIALSHLMKANKAASIIGSIVMNPFTAPFFWTISMAIGAFIMREDVGSIMSKIQNESIVKSLSWASFVYIVGNTIVSSVFTAATYYLVKRSISTYRTNKAARRHAERLNKAPR